MAEARGAAQGRHRGGGDRHARTTCTRRPRGRSSKRGIHVICDKPLTATLPEAKKLAKAAAGLGRAVRPHPQLHRLPDDPAGAGDGRATARSGTIRVVQVEYAQDWLSTDLEASGQKQADWRTDPARTGAGGSTGDIGTHAFNLASFVTGLTLESLAADLQSFVPGRRVDDNGHVLLRYRGRRARDAVVQPGRARQRERAAAAGLRREGRPRLARRRTRTISGTRRSASRSGCSPAAAPGPGPRRRASAAIPARPSRGLSRGLRHHLCRGRPRDPRPPVPASRSPTTWSFPTIEDGVAGVAFVDACVRSSAANGAWVTP